eukprot:4718756-Pyramimonas_sp.AAC.1
MSAVVVASISFHATAAGAKGVCDLAVDPSSVHQAEHMRSAVSARSADAFNWFDIPMWNQLTDSREIVRFPVNLPRDQFARSYEDDPASFDPIAGRHLHP